MAIGSRVKNPRNEARLSGASRSSPRATSEASNRARASTGGNARNKSPTNAFGRMLSGAAASSQAGRATTRPRTRSLRVTARRNASAAPIEMPPTTTGARPRASISEARSSAKVANENPSAGPASDPPCPRHSSVTQRHPWPKGKTSAGWAASPQRPCWNSIGCPSPASATARRKPARLCSGALNSGRPSLRVRNAGILRPFRPRSPRGRA